MSGIFIALAGRISIVCHVSTNNGPDASFASFLDFWQATDRPTNQIGPGSSRARSGASPMEACKTCEPAVIS